MRRYGTTLLVMILSLLMAVPTSAQDEGTVTLRFALSVRGEPPAGSGFYGLYGLPFSDAAFEVRLADPDGDGVYTGTAESPVNSEGETAYAIVRSTTGSGYGEGREAIFPENLDENGFELAELDDGATIRASVAYGGDVQNDQQGGMITKTFELTLNGDIPPGESFIGGVLPKGSDDGIGLYFCGSPKPGGTPGPDDTPCAGDGRVYTDTVTYPAGTTVEFTLHRNPADRGGYYLEEFHAGSETLDADMTNTAFYTFGDAGNDQQGGAPDNQQAGAGNGQQGGDAQGGRETPKLPNTGAGGLAGGVPAGAALLPVLGAGALVLRRRALR